MLLSSQFPVNYFSMSEVEQFFPEFADEYGHFERSLGGAGKFWRFNRLHDYANKARCCMRHLPVTVAAGQTSSITSRALLISSLTACLMFQQKHTWPLMPRGQIVRTPSLIGCRTCANG